MAFYLPRHNALFLLPPQTGGRQIRRVLKQLQVDVEAVGPLHAHKDVIGSLRFDRRPYTIAFVTNPLHWYAGYWHDAMQRDPHWRVARPDDLWNPTWPIDPGCGSDDFAEFIDRVTRRGGYLRDLFRLYTGRGTADEVDFIGRSDRLAADLGQVFARIGVGHHPAALDELSVRQHGENRYTPELTAMVVHAEQETFADYGYSLPTTEPTVLAQRRVAYPQRPGDIPGWFGELDRDVFRRILGWQATHEPPGDLVELGCYLGKSAVVMGEWLAADETFTVCDLFGDVGTDADNVAETTTWYPMLSRQEFERYYQHFRGTLPVIHQTVTANIGHQVQPASARFVHVDASHLYEHVKTDVASARTMLRPGGVVVFDDYRSAHTPGVAAAVWGEMALGELRPIALTSMKWYGTWGDPGPLQDELRRWLADHPRFGAATEQMAGNDALLLYWRGSREDPDSAGSGAVVPRGA